MTKLPYGGYELEDASNAPWLNLFSIAESLEKGEAIRPNLALWFAQAIRNANKSETRLLSNLGFSEKRGGQEKLPKGWLIYGQKVVELEEEGIPKDKAMSIVLQEIQHNDPNDQEGVSRSTLQRWRSAYKKAMIEYLSAHE